ncbi:hypothetical protein VF21_10391 [Pseudogymnoascus sp. 05NY08]|nr:hypothetical protein VF21_10391 [Pseudogymnoascus sp. 05NY08]
MGIFNMGRSIAPWFTFIILTMSEQRLRWDRSEVSRLRELYLNSPDIPIPSLTKAYNLNSRRHRTRNAVKCQLRMIRADLDAFPALQHQQHQQHQLHYQHIARSPLNEENSVWSAPELNIFIPRHPLEGEIPRLVVYTPCPEFSQEMADRMSLQHFLVLLKIRRAAFP